MVALGFFVAYFTEDEALTVHVWAGYVVGGLVLLRIIWGFVGPRHARFTDFTYRPSTVFAYLRDLMLGRAPRYIGHSPAGGAMVIALLLFLSMTVATGLVLYAEEEGAGPLAPLYAETALEGSRSGTDVELGREENGVERRGGRSSFEELHEAIANVTLALVIFHVLGVVLASFVHHENLSRAMVTGRKRRE